MKSQGYLLIYRGGLSTWTQYSSKIICLEKYTTISKSKGTTLLK